MNRSEKGINKYMIDVAGKDKITLLHVFELYSVSDEMREAIRNIVVAYNASIPTIDVRYKNYIDVYDIIDGFGITRAPHQHAIKKMLMTGKRGHKDLQEDLYDIIKCLSRV